MISIVNKRVYRGKGVYIGRPSLLGNPFKVSECTKLLELLDAKNAKIAELEATVYKSVSEYVILLEELEE